MALVTGTDFLIIGSTDVERSVKFYGETLGLERGKQWGKMPAHEFETGNLTIAVMQSDAFGLEFKPNTNPLEFRGPMIIDWSDPAHAAAAAGPRPQADLTATEAQQKAPASRRTPCNRPR